MDKEHEAIERLKLASQISLKIYKQPLIVTTSGGKDSSVCVELAQRAGIPFEVMHSHTTADAPETVYFVRDEFKRLEAERIKCTIDYHIKEDGKRITMWNLIPKMLMPPTRIVRYCCSVLKETSGKGRFIVTGVRWAESKRREKTRGIYEIQGKTTKDGIILNNDNDEKRQLFETCKLKGKRTCNPIIDWTDNDIWDYIESENIPINPLYKCGYNRVGCIGCPMAGKGRYKQFARYPKYKEAYMKAFNKMLDELKSRGFETGWSSANEVFHWWMEDGVLPGQFMIEGMEDDEY